MKIATWNVNSIRVRLEQVCQWVDDESPDVVCLQETKTVDDAFPKERITEIGMNVTFSGQKTYNGVAVLARDEMEDVVTDFPGFEDPQRRLLAVTTNDVRIINVYIPNGQSVESDKYQYKMQWLGHLERFVESELNRYDNVVLTGDFNIAPADEDVHDPEEWRDKILCSVPERQKYQALVGLGLTDSFRMFEHPPKTFSWWDYRAAAFRRNRGLRIDHILISDALRSVCQSCTIDKEPRKWQRPSDHTPVVAEFSI